MKTHPCSDCRITEIDELRAVCGTCTAVINQWPQQPDKMVDIQRTAGGQPSDPPRAEGACRCYTYDGSEFASVSHPYGAKQRRGNLCINCQQASDDMDIPF